MCTKDIDVTGVKLPLSHLFGVLIKIGHMLNVETEAAFHLKRPSNCSDAEVAITIRLSEYPGGSVWAV